LRPTRRSALQGSELLSAPPREPLPPRRQDAYGFPEQGDAERRPTDRKKRSRNLDANRLQLDFRHPAQVRSPLLPYTRLHSVIGYWLSAISEVARQPRNVRPPSRVKSRPASSSFPAPLNASTRASAAGSSLFWAPPRFPGG